MNDRAMASLGGYEVLAELDSGGMGEVLIARKRAVGGFERLVALKTVRGELANVGAARDMFLDEGRLLARLHHRGIAQVYDFGEDGDRLFLAMEYVAGIDFDDLADRHPPPRIACLAMAEALRALHAAHELTDHDGTPLGVVHRDVSPGNLMLTYDGQVKVLDFGIALMRNRRAPVTEFGMLKGKPPYMAPEQVRSEAIDPRTDVFSACVVLWEMLTDKRLFTGDSIFAIGRLIEAGEVDPPSLHRPDLPENLDALVLQGLSKNPEERFQSASSLANGLENVARTLGSESLAEYARRELAEDKAAHEAHITEIIRNAEKKPAKVGRSTSVNTIPAIAEIEGLAVADTAPGDDSTPEIEEEPPSRSWWPLLLVFVGLLVTVPLVIWQLSLRGDEFASLDVDAGVAPADVVVAPIDATIEPRSLDASIPNPRAIDASVPRRIDAGRRQRKPRDAGPRRPDKRDASARPRKRDAAVAPLPSGEGTITILTKKGTPYATVKIDGRSIGATPIYNHKLSAGPHVITWLRPGTSEVRKTVSIVVIADRHRTYKATDP